MAAGPAPVGQGPMPAGPVPEVLVPAWRRCCLPSRVRPRIIRNSPKSTHAIHHEHLALGEDVAW